MTGRNELCPCGSGKKFKKCCMDKKPSEPDRASPIEIRAAVLQDLHRMSHEQQLRMAQFGQVKPEIAIKYSGYQFVAVGKRLFYAKEWKSFADFLIGYVPEVFDKKWWAAEIAKPQVEWNQVCEWREAMRRYAKAQQPLPDGTYRIARNGFSAAYLTFAYDMYVVEHNGRLDQALVERLKNKDQFQGARHELFAEATCLRAGFTIEREDEKDRTRKHAEFVATHLQSGLKFSVEAKSKHRAGVLGRPGTPQPHEKISLSFGQLINSALAKNPPNPLVVFIDTNLPPRAAQRLYAPHIRDGREIPSRLLMALLDRVAQEHDGNDPYAMLVFCNHPHHYASPDDLDPQRNLLAVSARNLSATLRPALHAFYTAARLYGNIPNELPAS